VNAPEIIELGQLLRTRQTLGRVTEISADGETITLRTPWHTDSPTPRSDILRPLISVERARALLERLAIPGARDAVLPADPEARELIAQIEQSRELPEEEQYEASRDRRAALSAWFEARSPEDLIDDIRHAIAARLGASSDPRSYAVMALHEEARELFLELAAVTGRSLIDIEYGVAHGHRATAPRELVGHSYLGSFLTTGRLIAADFCHLDSKSDFLRTSIHGKPGRYHAWVSWSPGTGAQEHGLLVAHEDSLDLLGTPTRKVGAVFNDAGMVGVYDAKAAGSASLQDWLRAQADAGAVVLGITDGDGVLARSEGDGAWEVRAAHVDSLAVVIRVVLHTTATGKEPIVVASSPSTSAARAYSPRETFAAGDSIAHPKFGQGRVLSASRDTMEVAFPDAIRKLVHGR
jgi:hypothetical protein